MLLFLLCGCTKKANVTPVMQGISFTADVQYGGSNYLADVSLQEECLNLIVHSPENINVLTLIVDKNGTTAKFTSKSVGTYTITVTIDDYTADCIVNVVEDMTGVDNATTVTIEPRKQIVNGQVLIRTQDGTYTLMGQEI